MSSRSRRAAGGSPPRWPTTAPRRSDVTIDSVDTKPLFFALERQPGRLEIRTVPDNATLYVRGNRARNPYVQNVEPGSYEVYAEAPSYESRSQTFDGRAGRAAQAQFSAALRAALGPARAAGLLDRRGRGRAALAWCWPG